MGCLQADQSRLPVSLFHFVFNIGCPNAPGEQSDLSLLRADIATLKETLMATHAEVVAQLAAAADRLDKAEAEIIARIGGLVEDVAELQALLAELDNPSPELLAVAARIEEKAAALDELNPDA